MSDRALHRIRGVRSIRGARVTVIGAGVAGLAAASHLAAAGAEVRVLEREGGTGGMASAFDAGGQRLDRYYLYFSGGDREVMDLAAALMPDEPIVWRAAPVGIFYEGRSHDFSTPLDLVSFPPLTKADRARLVAHMLRCLATRDPASLQRIPASTWLRRWLGDRGYRAVWEPLLRHKFGRHVDRVSSAWLWARIRRMAHNPEGMVWRRAYGYLPGGSHRLIDRLAERVVSQGVGLHTSCPVTRLVLAEGRVAAVAHGDDESTACDAVVSTIPLRQLAALIDPAALESEGESWPPAIDYLPVTVLVLRLSRPLTPYFWLNTNDPGFHFPGVIGYSNLDEGILAPGQQLAYLPFYGDPGASAHSLSPDELLDVLDADLRRVNPGYDRSQVLGAWVFRDRFGQSVCHIDEAPLEDPGLSPLENLFVTDASLLHPEDRTIEGALGQGRRAARQLIESLEGGAA
jgi:protoporphyrinogen oxidase